MAGLFSCCFRPKEPTAELQAVQVVNEVKSSPRETSVPTPKDTPNSKSKTPNGSVSNSTPIVQRSQSFRSLNAAESHIVQDTLSKVGTLIQKFAEGRSDKHTPVQGVKRALHLIVSDCQAVCASAWVVSEDRKHALVISCACGPEFDIRLRVLTGSGASADLLLSTGLESYCWDCRSEKERPSDYELPSSGLVQLVCVPIKLASTVIGALTVVFEEKEHDVGQEDFGMWPSFMQLVSASLGGLVKDSAFVSYLELLYHLQEAPDLDSLIHKLLENLRQALRQKHNHHIWYRVGFVNSTNSAATVCDDLSQVAPGLVQRSLCGSGSGSSMGFLKEPNGGVVKYVVPMKNTVIKLAVNNRQQVIIPDVQKLINQSGNVSSDIFLTRLVKPPVSVLVYPLRVGSCVYGALFCMSSVQYDFSELAWRVRDCCELLGPHLLTSLTTRLATEYKVLQTAQPPALNSVGDSEATSGSRISGSRAGSRQPSGSNLFAPGAASGSNLGMSGSQLQIQRSSSLSSLMMDSFNSNLSQSRSLTGALVTGLTEKLNQKRIKSSMDFVGPSSLAELQLTGQLGEGGFAKVFRGLWRGLVVAVKVVIDSRNNERLSVKNAHEIAILSSLSHPNILQAYTCLTDVAVADLLTTCVRGLTPGSDLLASTGYAALTSANDKLCHIEVVEYCDMGNLSSAVKTGVFLQSQADEGSSSSQAPGTTMISLRRLLVTLVEVASAMAYLHQMGVVHCDLKPANILLKGSTCDSRTFTTKVSDFGLSRVEDDDVAASFPFNSCGTAAYVAPEALISKKKVNSSVDVYAFGIIMWEMFTGLRPYSNMKQQKLVQEVVIRGLRPRFPSSCPASYQQLAAMCWAGTSASRPNFEDVLHYLHVLLQQLDEGVLDKYVPNYFDLSAGDCVMEYCREERLTNSSNPSTAKDRKESPPPSGGAGNTPPGTTGHSRDSGSGTLTTSQAHRRHSPVPAASLTPLPSAEASIPENG